MKCMNVMPITSNNDGLFYILNSKKNAKIVRFLDYNDKFFRIIVTFLNIKTCGPNCK